MSWCSPVATPPKYLALGKSPGNASRKVKFALASRISTPFREEPPPHFHHFQKYRQISPIYFYIFDVRYLFFFLRTSFISCAAFAARLFFFYPNWGIRLDGACIFAPITRRLFAFSFQSARLSARSPVSVAPDSVANYNCRPSARCLAESF